MSKNYEVESSHVADYNLYNLPGINFSLRGPFMPEAAGLKSISFLGAAQTFGVLCNHPFANLLGEMCSARVVNLGRGGAGPGFYLRNRNVFNEINKTSCCIVQVMSARSSPRNSYMESPYGLASVVVTRGEMTGQTLLGHVAFEKLHRELSTNEFTALVKETREGFIHQMIEIRDLIKVPTVLLYCGKSAPLAEQSDPSRNLITQLIGSHPHLVTQSMVKQLSTYYDQTHIVYGDKGADAPILNRFTGEKVTIRRSDRYTITKHDAYISPYLHTRIALELYDPIMRILNF